MRIVTEERLAFSPDALTGMEQNLRFVGKGKCRNPHLWTSLCLAELDLFSDQMLLEKEALPCTDTQNNPSLIFGGHNVRDKLRRKDSLTQICHPIGGFSVSKSGNQSSSTGGEMLGRKSSRTMRFTCELQSPLQVRVGHTSVTSKCQNIDGVFSRRSRKRSCHSSR